MYDFLLRLLRDSLPELVGSLLSTTVLTVAGRGAKKARERLRARQVPVDALRPAPGEGAGHRRAA
ncbi:hypothetical protein [Streptomyces sp. NPDC058964]|uniref:hypothetical protein n=1 Tax=Streptomyces sp. NPDC058964 TaxID=3346681 RepID=UPI00367AFABF